MESALVLSWLALNIHNGKLCHCLDGNKQSLEVDNRTDCTYRGGMCSLRATYGFNTWMKWKRPAKTIFLFHILHDNLTKEGSSLISFSRGREALQPNGYHTGLSCPVWSPGQSDT